MNSRMVRYLAAAAASAALIPAVAHAQWSLGSNDTLKVGDGTGTQGDPRVQPSGDGGYYVTWTDSSSGYDVRMQKLNAAGVEQWAHNGIVVADRSYSSTEIGGDLCVLSDGSVIVAYDDKTDPAFPTMRQGVVQKISPTGTLLWGAGVSVTSGTTGCANIQAAAMPDGGCVVGWSLRTGFPYSAAITRLDTNGVPVVGWETPMAISEVGAGCQLGDLCVLDGAGSFGAIWSRTNTTGANANKYLYMQKFNAAGVAQWNSGSPVDVYSNAQGQAAWGGQLYPQLVSDGAGGAVVGWYEITNNPLPADLNVDASAVAPKNANFQHILSDGTLKFPDAAAPVHQTSNVAPTGATYKNRMRQSAALAYNATEGSYFLASTDGDRNPQGNSGALVQKFNAAGQRQWGDDGVVVVPVVSGFNGSNLLMSCISDGQGGCMVFGMDNRGQTTTKRIIFAVRVESEGSVAWSKVLNSDVTTDKGNRMGVCAASTPGDAIVGFVWGDDTAVAKVAASDGFPAVTPECVSIVVDAPAAIGVCQGDTVVIPVTVTGTPNIAFQWQKGHKNTGNFVNLFDGETGAPFFTPDGSSHSGAQTGTLTITNVQSMSANEGKYQCTMFNACPGLPITTSTTFITVSVPLCPADYDCNGLVSIDDLFQYINGYFTSAPRADFNHEGGITIDDLFLYINAYFLGC